MGDGVIQAAPGGARHGTGDNKIGGRADFQNSHIEPMRAVMVEDLPQNLQPAHDLGMTTVLIRTDRVTERHGATDENQDHIHHVEDDLLTWLKDIFES